MGLEKDLTVAGELYFGQFMYSYIYSGSHNPGVTQSSEQRISSTQKSKNAPEFVAPLALLQSI